MSGISEAQPYERAPASTSEIAWSSDGVLLAAIGSFYSRSGTRFGDVALWGAGGGRGSVFDRSSGSKRMLSLAWHPEKPVLALGGAGGQVHIWDAASYERRRLAILPEKATGVSDGITALTWTGDGSMLIAAERLGRGGAVGIWDAEARRLIRKIEYPAFGNSLSWCPVLGAFLSAGSDGVISMHAIDGPGTAGLGRHEGAASFVDVSPDGAFAASASEDRTVKVWDLAAKKELVTLEGHNESVGCVQFSPDGRLLASKTEKAVHLWRRRDWECVARIPTGDASGGARAGGLAFHPALSLLAVRDNHQQLIHCYTIDCAVLDRVDARRDSRRYVNAKVVLLGDTGVGKSGLGLVLSGQAYRPTESTHGRRVWTFDTREVGRQTREVLLWDLAGQPGYRLVHQLHLNEIAVALLVFDSRSETDPFAGVKHWVRALAQARRLEDTAVPLRTYLVAARADRGGVPVSRERVKAMIDDLGLDGFFETSAKEGWQVTELTDAIKSAIDWDALPRVSSSALFDSIKQFLLNEKEQGRVLSTADDLFRGFVRANPGAGDHDTLRDSFETCIGLVESRDLIRRLRFGGLVLLQPELLDAYASALVQAAKDEPDGLGFIREADALDGRFRLSAEERMADQAQEKLLLIATVEELLRHEIALKEATDEGVDLVFPSQFTRERPDAPGILGKQVTFAFEGPLHSIYASLAVRLAHSSLFRRQTMWQNAASYTAAVGGTCGIYLRELEEGRGELALFYDEQAGAAVRGQFETYVAEHLQQRALPGTIVRRAIRSCSACGYVLPDDLVRGRLNRGLDTVRCPMCDETVIPLHDDQPSGATAEAAVSEMNRNADEQRDRNVAATRLKGKVETGDFDVFLCHNSKDKPQVMAIGERLKERGILPWLDVWEIPPGKRWQQEVRRAIKSVKTVAVFYGPGGAGPFQELEVESLVGEFAKRGKPIIPVILEGRQGNPRLSGFLNAWQKVDMRKPNPDPFEQLVWGITGDRSSDPG